MKFYPVLDPPSSQKKKGLLDKIGSAAKGAVKNLVNNATGGLIGSLMNSKVSISKMHDDFEYAHKDTFLEYLAAANLLVGSEDWIGENAGQVSRPLELQLGLYCQEVTIPNLEVPTSGQSTVNSFGEFPLNGLIVKPDSNVLTLKILNTKVPLHERIFYPWMREVTLPFWSYETQPYTTATITVDFTKHNDVSYVFYGCRPQKIIMQQATQAKTAANLARDVYFIFDFMAVHSKLKNIESIKSKLIGAGKTMLNAASKMVKF